MLKHRYIFFFFGFAFFACQHKIENTEKKDEFFELQAENDSIQQQLDSLNKILTDGNQDVLVGTTFLPYSNKMIGLLNQGLEPISFEILERCDQSVSVDTTMSDVNTKITAIQREANTLTIDLVINANCCHHFLGEAEISNDTLKLFYTSYGGFCGCTCLFKLRYVFDTTLELDYQLLQYVAVEGSNAVGKIPNP